MRYVSIKGVCTVLLILYSINGLNSDQTSNSSEKPENQRTEEPENNSTEKSENSTNANGNNSHSDSDEESLSVFEKVIKRNKKNNASIRSQGERFSQHVGNLFKNYKPYLPPFVGSFDHVFWLNVSVISKELIEIDEIEERLSVVMEFKYMWMDERLAWETEEMETNGSSEFFYLPINEDKIWTPTFEVANQHHSKMSGSGKKSNNALYVFRSGGILWVHTKSFNTICNIDTTYYPFDRQICHVHFVAQIPYFLFALNFSHEVEENRLDNGNWRFIEVNVYQYFNYRHLIYHVTVEYVFQRKPFAPLIILIIPVFMLVSLVPLVFLLPKDGGDRLGLALTVLLAVSVYMTMVADKLPSSSDPIPYITIVFFIWYISCAVIVLLVLMNAKLYHKRNHKDIPRLLRRLVMISRRCFCLGDEDTEQTESEQTCIDEDGTPFTEKRTEANSTEHHSVRAITWQHVSLCLDKWFILTLYCVKILFAVITFLILYHGDQNKTETEEIHIDSSTKPYSYEDNAV
ncbi:neuronal acetylcholine receptor subunit beta-3-like [Mya arenaria]|uniref:neuronal acetylcholine receptor subunit beta-3-like n=1 Tax=Mya arenaria TaxID=6604 RepID=UPI0022E1D319|nr:neuronal acetylcholine receptor subunit beta-3-like [Mya arenaria]